MSDRNKKEKTMDSKSLIEQIVSSNEEINPSIQEEPPPVLGSWRNLYILVLGNLLFWILLFTFFTWMFQ